jgi:hypothetical protein
LTGKETITDKNINNQQEGLYNGQETKSLPRPELNANITFRSPDTWGPDILGTHLLGGWDLTIFASYRAGNYFTWNPAGLLHLNNNLQWPDYYMFDLKLSKSFNISGVRTTFFLDVSNIFNIKVSQMDREYAFANDDDMRNYLASLHLPMYDSPDYDALRASSPGNYIAGDDKVGDLRSPDKPYINDPNYSFWLYKQPRDIWFGLRVDF